MRDTIVMYDVCDDSVGCDPTPSLGTLFPTLAEAKQELKEQRLEYPRAYIAKIVQAPYRGSRAKKNGEPTEKTMVMYELFTDPPGEEPWKPMGTIYPTKAEALKDLKTYILDHPTAYMAKVVYTRIQSPVAKKGR